MDRGEQLREERKEYFENGGSVEDFPPDGTSIEYPHCDPRVLHSPGACDVCDKSASKLQKMRIDQCLAFTDELALEDPLLPGSDRTRESADSWGGNRSDPGPRRPHRIDPMGYRVPPAAASVSDPKGRPLRTRFGRWPCYLGWHWGKLVCYFCDRRLG